MRHFRAEIDHMRLQTADPDHIRAQLHRFRLDLHGHCRRIVDRYPLRIHWPVSIGRQFHPTGAIGLDSRLHRRIVTGFGRPSGMNHLGQHRIGHALLSSGSDTAHEKIFSVLDSRLSNLELNRFKKPSPAKMPWRKEKYRLIFPNLVSFASLRESSFPIRSFQTTVVALFGQAWQHVKRRHHANRVIVIGDRGGDQ
jgi:hypothetical protein